MSISSLNKVMEESKNDAPAGTLLTPRTSHGGCRSPWRGCAITAPVSTHACQSYGSAGYSDTIQ
jgi:hypothetical protein